LPMSNAQTDPAQLAGVVPGGGPSPEAPPPLPPPKRAELVYGRPFRVGPAAAGATKALVQAVELNPFNGGNWIVDAANVKTTYSTTRKQYDSLAPVRNALDAQRKELIKAEEKVKSSRAAQEAERHRIEYALASEMKPSHLTDLLDCLKKECAATGVYLGEVKEEGEGKRHIEYFAASKGHEFMIGASFPDNCLSFEVFNKAEEEPPAPRKHHWAPAPTVEFAAYGESTQTLYVRDVMEAEKLKFFGVPRPGQLFVVPVVFMSGADPEAETKKDGLIKAVAKVADGIAERKKFDENLASGDAPVVEKKEEKKGKKGKDDKKGKKAAKAVEKQEAEDGVEQVAPEQIFDMLDALEPPEAKHERRWVLCLDTLGSLPRDLPGMPVHDSDVLEPDREITPAQRELVRGVAQILAEQAARDSAVKCCRQRDFLYHRQQGVVSQLFDDMEAQREVKMEGMAPQKAAATTSTAKKDDKKKKGKKVEKAAEQSAEQDEGAQQARLIQIDTCVKQGEFLRTQVLQLREHPALPKFAEDLLDAMLCGFLDAELPKIDMETRQRYLTADTVQRAFRILDPEAEQDEAAKLRSRTTIYNLAYINEKLESLPKPDELKEVNLGLELLARWMRLYAEHRQFVTRPLVDHPGPMDFKICTLMGKKPQLAAWIDDLKENRGWTVGPLEAKANDEAGLVLPPLIPGGTEGFLYPCLVTDENGAAYMLEEEEAEKVIQWVKEGGVLLVGDGQQKGAMKALNNAFEWNLEPFSGTPDASANARHKTAHMFSMAAEEFPGNAEFHPVRKHPAGSNFVVTVPRQEKSFPLLGGSLPPGAVPVLESSAVYVVLVPEGQGYVVVSTLDAKFDAELQGALVARQAPAEPLDNLLYDQMFALNSNSLGEEKELSEAAAKKKTQKQPPGTKAFERGEDVPTSALFESFAALFTFTHLGKPPSEWKNEAETSFRIHNPDGADATIKSHEKCMCKTVNVQTSPGFWGSCLVFKEDDALVHVNVTNEANSLLPGPGEALQFPEGEGLLPFISDEFGWTVSAWFLPTRRSERNDQHLLVIEDLMSPLEIRITPQEKLLAYSGADLLPDKARKEAEDFGQEEVEAGKRSGVSEEVVRFGGWNHIAIVQKGLVRYVYLNGALCVGCNHRTGRPARDVKLEEALFKQGEDTIGTRTPFRIRVSGPLVPETPTPGGPFDVEAGTGRLPFRGMVGTLSYWVRPLPEPDVRFLWARSYAANLFHPLADAPLRVGGAGSNADVLVAAGAAIGDSDVAAVRRGSHLLATARTEEDVAALAASFGWNLQVGVALPGAARVPDPHPDVAAFENCAAEVSGSIALDGRSLPAMARAVYESTVVDLFSAPAGEGRVVYLGYCGAGTDQATGWRAALARVLRGQTGFDIVGPAGG